MKKTSFGYSVPDELDSKIKDIETTSLPRSIIWMLFDHFIIWLPTPLLMMFGGELIEPLYITLLIACLCLSARCLRGLECMVHEGSHSNHCRENRKINDFVTNALAAFPVFGTVEKYRESHARHHAFLGTELDPDFVRYKSLGLRSLNRSGWFLFFCGLVIRMHKYIPSWWVAIGTDLVVVMFGIAWHLALISIATYITGSFLFVLQIWGVAFLVPFFFLLPFIRFIGESGEHDYAIQGSVIAITYTNDGGFHRVLVHPHNDGLHSLHHVRPIIPFYNLRKAHLLLGEFDKYNYRDVIRERIGILG